MGNKEKAFGNIAQMIADGVQLKKAIEAKLGGITIRAHIIRAEYYELWIAFYALLNNELHENDGEYEPKEEKFWVTKPDKIIRSHRNKDYSFLMRVTAAKKDLILVSVYFVPSAVDEADALMLKYEFEDPSLYYAAKAH